MPWSLGVAISVASGILLVAVALVVLKVAPRERANLAFAVTVAGFGTYIAASYAEDGSFSLGGGPLALHAVALLGSLAFFVGAVLLAPWFPTSFAQRERRPIVLPAIVFGVTFLGRARALGLAVREEGMSMAVAAEGFFVLTYPAMLALLVLWAERWRHANDGRLRTQLALGTAAFGTHVGLVAGTGALVLSLDPNDMLWLVPMGPHVGAVLLVAALWLRNVAGSTGADARAARNLALYLLATVLAGVVVGALQDAEAAAGSGPHYGIARFVMVLLLAYATVRHQLLGIDVKVRWTISKSTVAAVFIAVFFVASESAAVFLGEKWGTYGGIIAAGGLVFAIAPLQQFAERVADRAMPGVTDTMDHRMRQQEDVYKVAVRLALQDGTVTRAEEHHLAEVAEGLGIPATRALRLREDVEGTTASRRDATSGQEPV
ncbi:MAG: hypothetical protein KY455_05830 [Euryarchaeota archaeon]|nr:hypothetical protein [Euryarchaeota archaeon]